LSLKGRITLLQLGRFSPLCEQTYRNQFEKKFDFFSDNKQLINQTISDERIIAYDPCYIPKAGKSTYGSGRYWSGVAGATNMGFKYHISFDLSNEGITIYSFIPRHSK